MFVPRLITTQCVFVPLVLCSLVMLCGASVAPTQTKQRHPAAGPHSNLFVVQGNCTTKSSTPVFPPSLSLRVFLYYRRFGFWLQITPEGQIRGSYKLNNYTKLEMESVGSCGLIRIKGIATGRYLAMKNVTSQLYTQVQPPNMDAVFRSGVTKEGFTLLESYQYKNRYVGLNKNLRPRKGSKVRPGHVNRYGEVSRDGEFFFFIWSPQKKGPKPLSL